MLNLSTMIPQPHPLLTPQELKREVTHKHQKMDSFGEFARTALSRLPEGGSQHLRLFDGPLDVSLIGDFGHSSEAKSHVLDTLAKNPGSSGLLLSLGDMVYPRGPENRSPEEIQRALRQLEPLSALTTKYDTYGVLGNHEYGDEGGESDVSIVMDLANKQGLKIPGRYYQLACESKDFAVDFFCLDTTQILNDQQLIWLKSQMAASKTKEDTDGRPRWRVIVAHHPLKSHGWHHERNNFLGEYLKDVLPDCHLWLAGHEHHQEVNHYGNLPVVISGAASENRGKLDTVTKPSYEHFSSSTGFTKTQFSRDGVAINAVDEKGRACYSYQITRPSEVDLAARVGATCFAC